MTESSPDYSHLRQFARTSAEHETLDLLETHGSQRRAAAAAGQTRDWLRDRLRRIQRRAAGSPAEEAPVVKGAVEARQARPVPGRGRTRVFVLTSAQNNTPVHEAFWANLAAYAAHRRARLMVSRFSYDVTAYGAKSTKAGKDKSGQGSELWYDPALSPYVCDDPKRHGSCRWQLAPDLLWCAEMNISPSAVNPLSGLETYGGGSSVVFPHATIAAKGLPVLGDKDPRFAYTTGACTLRNYIAKKAGIKAEFHHTYGALIVEVDTQTGHWWARQLNASEDGSFYDLDTFVKDGKVTTGHRPEAIQWGDIHAAEMDADVRELNWGAGGALDTLRPKYQFMHDTMSFVARSHHRKSFGERYQAHLAGGPQNSVQAEVEATAAFLHCADRPFCETVVVNSNHDRHLDRWLDEADYREDPENAEFYLQAALARVQAWKEGKRWNALRWALGPVPRTAFLDKDESFVICPDHPVQCGQHGDAGINGSRGTTAGYTKITERINKGHAHTAELRNGVACAGVCLRKASYCHGASSWSITHVLTYPSGKRALLTQRGGKLWL